MTRTDLWTLIHAERRRLADDVAPVTEGAWRTPSVVGTWTAEETLAHLTAGAAMTLPGWLRSVLRARGDFHRHNATGVAAHHGATPATTLARFRAQVSSRRRAAGPVVGVLGEVLVHGEEIRRSLGLASAVPPSTVAVALRWFAAHDFTEHSRSRAAGLRLVADDAELAVGDVGDPEVRGTALALLMAVCGRPTHLAELTGPGAELLAARCAPGWRPDRCRARVAAGSVVVLVRQP